VVVQFQFNGTWPKKKNWALENLTFRNDWVFIATLSPDSSEIHVLKDGKFERYEPESTELPVAESSVAWYRGWRDHLGFAVIRHGSESSSAKAETSL